MQHDEQELVACNNANLSGLLLNAVEAARFLGVSKRQVFRLDAAAAMPRPVRIGMSTRRFWRRDELAHWVAASCPAREKWEEHRRLLESDGL